MYRNYVIVIFLCLLLISAVNAQTYVSGSVSGTWPAGVYYATDSLLVESGNTLTILPGVELYFQVDQKFQIEGTLNVNGNETDSVIISYDSESIGEFAGIRFLSGSGGQISYARIEGGATNSPDIQGGGIYISQASPDISNCKIVNCNAMIGGGLYVDQSSSVIEYCEIYNNNASYAAGAYLSGDLIFQYNSLHHNTAGNNGGGFNIVGDDTPTVENNIVYNNTAQNGGGMAFIGASAASGVMNNLFYGNTATAYGGGIYLFNDATNGTIRNSIIWNNSATDGGSQIFIQQGYLDIDYSDIQNGETDIEVNEEFEGSYLYGTNNISGNPAFSNVGNADFHFEYSSPVVEAGTNLGAPSEDFDGNSRPFDGNRDDVATVDMGPYEYTNTAPSITSTAITSAAEDAQYTYDVDADDPDLDETLTFSLSTSPDFLGINGGNGEITGTPDNDDIGLHPVTVVVTDLNGATDTQNFTLEVENVNDAPIVSPSPDQEIDEGGTFTAIALDNYVDDVDNPDSEITWVASGNVDLGVDININTRVAVITIPNANWNGSETITFTASDTEPLSDDDAVVFTVNSINDLPVVSNIPGQTIDEGATFTTINLDDYVDDVDHTDAEITWTYAGNTELTVDIASRVATIGIPGENWNGSETITFTATDPDEDSDSDDATFQVTSINDLPVVTNIPDQTIDEGATFTTITLDDYVSDEDHTDAEITWTYAGNTELTVDITARVATIGIPGENWNGSETITFTATDPEEGSANDAAVFTVSSQNDAPVVTDIPDQTIDEGATFATITLDDYVSDIDHTDAEITWSYSGNTDLTVDITDRVATVGIPDVNWNGSEMITFTATDPLDGNNSDAATFAVTSINDAPVVADIPDQMINEGATFAAITLDDYVSDVDHPDAELTWEYSGNVELLVDITDRVATIGIPSENWNGNETITFTVTDPGDSTASDNATFDVNNVNDPPVISDIDPQVFNEDDSLSYTIAELLGFVHDPDHPDSLLLFMPYPGENVTVELVDDTLVVFSAPENWNGLDTLMVIVSDLELADTALIAFEVKPVNDIPFFTDEVPDTITVYVTAEENMNIGDFADDYDFDMPGDSLRWEVSVSDDTLKFDFDADTKDLTLTAPGYTDVFTVTITVTDDSAATAEGMFYVNVTLDPTAIEDNLEYGIPTEYVLKQNYPNPFNPTTHIKFGMPQAGDVVLEVYNLLGQKIVTLFEGYKAAGYHMVDFDASNLPTGMYFYRIQSDKFQSVKKMMLVK